MSMQNAIPGDGASMPWFRPQSVTEPALMVCPIFALEPGMGVIWAAEIYRLAHERALATLRPSAYEMMQWFCGN